MGWFEKKVEFFKYLKTAEITQFGIIIYLITIKQIFEHKIVTN